MAKDQSADGLRGVAAISVLISHAILAFFPAALTLYFPSVAEPSAISGRVEGVLSTPGWSVLWNGRFAVLVFFVLSGYVLTKSIVALQDASIARSLAVRRYLRLAGPVLASALVACGLMRLGLYCSPEVAAITSSAWLKSMWLVTPDFFHAAKEGIYGAIFRGDGLFNPVFWTMRVEFVGSLLILAYRCLTMTRRGLLVGLPVYVVLMVTVAPNDYIYYFAFLLGTHLNDVPVVKGRIWLCMLAPFGIYLGGIHDAPSYAWLGFIPGDVPTRNGFLTILGAALLVYAVKGGAFSTFLTTSLVRFLGRISYSLYLVHMPMLLSVGCGTYLWLVVGHGFGRVGAASIAITLYTLATLAAATVLTRFVDEPCIKLAKRLFPGGTAVMAPAPSKLIQIVAVSS